MNELEAKVRCLEVAAGLAKAQGITTSEGVVKIQTELYSALTSGPSTDKPLRGPGKKTPT